MDSKESEKCVHKKNATQTTANHKLASKVSVDLRILIRFLTINPLRRWFGKFIERDTLLFRFQTISVVDESHFEELKS